MFTSISVQLAWKDGHFYFLTWELWASGAQIWVALSHCTTRGEDWICQMQRLIFQYELRFCFEIIGHAVSFEFSPSIFKIYLVAPRGRDAGKRLHAPISSFNDSVFNDLRPNKFDKFLLTNLMRRLRFNDLVRVATPCRDQMASLPNDRSTPRRNHETFNLKLIQAVDCKNNSRMVD